MISRVWGLVDRVGRRLIGTPGAAVAGSENASYWTRHNVTLHRQFASREESLAYLDWRNAQYMGYAALLPTAGHDGEVVLDYGCGPGNDLVGFVEHSRPARVIGMDVSPASLAEATRRLALHPRMAVEIVRIDDGADRIPLDDGIVDYVHSSGVLHHTPNMETILAEFRRVLKPGGRAGIMVYNRDSVWLHLYVAWKRRIAGNVDANETLDDAFCRSTDGPECPISRCFTPDDFVVQCTAAGFRARFVGAAISLFEMELLPSRFLAMQDLRLPGAHREFLESLTFDERGVPRYRGVVAGIDACYQLVKE